MRALYMLLAAGLAAAAAPQNMASDADMAAGELPVLTIMPIKMDDHAFGDDGSVHVEQASRGDDQLLTIDLTENMMESEDVLLKTSVNVKLEVDHGMVMVNDQFKIPMGIAQMEITGDVDEYKVTDHGMRLLDATETRPVALKVVTDMSYDEDEHMHIVIEVYEAAGIDLMSRHYRAIEIVLDDEKNEYARIAMDEAPAPAPIGPIDDLPYAPPLEPYKQEMQHEVHRAHVAMHRFVCWFHHQPLHLKVLLLTSSSVFLLLVVSIMVRCVSLCCCSRDRHQGRPHARSKHQHVHVLSPGKAQSFIPMRKYAYEKVPVSTV